MSVLRRTPVRQLLIVSASVAILVALAAAALGQGGPHLAPSQPVVVDTMSGSLRGTTTAAGPGIIASGSGVYPSCCAEGSVQGITATGQAEVHGSGPAARDAALARAVGDATDQAQAVAGAAGITLGAPVDLQISSPPFVYPMEGQSPPGGPEAVGPTVPVPYPTFVSVTITWALG
jgi:Protein of unknown function (DUF541)